jgi:hypothetical protein
MQRHTSILAIIAFASASAIFLTVLGGVHAFIWRASADHTLVCMLIEQVCAARGTTEGATAATQQDPIAGVYVVLAGFACLLLAVPFITLAASAARLAASRRDTRLAALRLVGATVLQVSGLTALDAAGQALSGALLGIGGYCALMPLVTLIPFQNQRFTFVQLWVGPWMLLAVCAAVTAMALVSALAALHRVSITPLGVASRASQPLPAVWRAVVFAGVLVLAIGVFRMPQLAAYMGQSAMMVIVMGLIALCFFLVNLVGTWAIVSRAKRRLRRPRNAATMIAMRRILDNPKRAWRNVSGIALAVFIAGITSVCAMFSQAADASTRQGSASVILIRDIGTGGLLTLAFAAILAAVSCGVMQAGNVYEQAEEYRMLALEGTDACTLNRARFAEVITPLNVVVVIAGGCSMALMLPLMAGAMTNSMTLLAFFGGIALCYALVSIGVLVSNRVASKLDLFDYRADD